MRKAADVERVAGMTRERFFNDYFRKRPVIFEGAVRHWEAVRSWSPEFFSDRYGDLPIRVDRYDPDSSRTYLEQHIDYVHREVPFRDFIASLSQPSQRFSVREDRNLLQEVPELVSALEHFRGFASGQSADRYCSLWFNAAGDVTGLHADLVEGHLFQIHGRKQFYFISPEQSPLLYEQSSEAFDDPSLAERIDEDDLEDFRHYIRWPGVNFFHPDYAKHPLQARAEYLEGIIEPGDLIYVPEGWWHATRSLTISISVAKRLDPAGLLQDAT